MISIKRIPSRSRGLAALFIVAVTTCDAMKPLPETAEMIDQKTDLFIPETGNVEFKWTKTAEKADPQDVTIHWGEITNSFRMLGNAIFSQDDVPAAKEEFLRI